jgi:hypothetical protein
MRLLDLFSGTHSVASVARDLGYEVVTLDLAGSDINIDILLWDYTVYAPGHWDVIWASPPCNTFSVAKQSNIGRFGVTQESIEADVQNVGLPLVRKTEEIINYFQPSKWFIENPQSGKLKQYLDKPHYDVDYCCYCDWGYRKRTRVWTNTTGFKPKLCPGVGLCPSMEGPRHRSKATGGNKTQKGQSQLNQRYRIPPNLLTELLSPPPATAPTLAPDACTTHTHIRSLCTET